jgi:hypothetical protein
LAKTIGGWLEPVEVSMFVEGEVEIKAQDKSVLTMDDHNLKLWVNRSFNFMSCYRISSCRIDKGTVRAVVALKTTVVPEQERRVLESVPENTERLRSFMEKLFAAKGTCRCVGDPKLKAS